MEARKTDEKTSPYKCTHGYSHKDSCPICFDPSLPNEIHERCMHCGDYVDECQCDGGIS